MQSVQEIACEFVPRYPYPCACDTPDISCNRVIIVLLRALYYREALNNLS